MRFPSKAKLGVPELVNAQVSLHALKGFSIGEVLATARTKKRYCDLQKSVLTWIGLLVCFGCCCMAGVFALACILVL